MTVERIRIPMPKGMEDAEIVAYLPDNSEQIAPERVRKTVMLCAGGGYRFRSDREAEPVALKLLAAGFNVFIVEYHLPADSQKYAYPIPQLELAAAIAHVRKNAQKYHVRPDRILTMGFSAGGHLACSAGVLFNDPQICERLGVSPADIRPDGMVLCYPVITGGPYTHEDSMRRLFATEDRTVWEAHSLENLVHDQVPPVFLWSTFEDELVPVENTLYLASALRRCGVNTELHIFPHGQHGLSLDTPEVFGPYVMTVKPQYPEIRCWIDLAIRWITEL